MGHNDLRPGQIVYILVFYNILFSWLLPQDGFQFIFLSCDSENDLLDEIGQEKKEERDDVDGKESTTRSGRRIRRRAPIDWLYH